MSNWTSEYYEIMEFYFWEPQHLDLIKKGTPHNNAVSKRSKSEVLAHIQRMEVSLNHIFNIFFQLAPADFTFALVRETTGFEPSGPLQMVGRHDLFNLTKIIQPDLLLRNETLNFSIEMKIDAKSTLQQVWKYALLHWLEEQDTHNPKSSALLYIGKGAFRTLWAQRYETAERLMAAALAMDVEELEEKATRKSTREIVWPEVRAVLERTRISLLSYPDFDRFLLEYTDAYSAQDPATETLRKLFDGLRAELVDRGLV